MGIGDFVDKAKDLAGQHPDQVDQGIEKAGDAVDQRTGAQHAEQVDKAQDAVRDRLAGGDQQPPA
ncbi:antitoxin [Microlunatus flavus]|uniref:MT0933-like antitoxin protein n=1 Tax=Microlunatus flavus TaxID=1036181 RepID=A0A1H9ABU0_9ACTN|nr:antitoxin [Microlunatus flavus]SEP74085.1 MT0933-like antitoxin protein [Microlunatus flavus]